MKSNIRRILSLLLWGVMGIFSLMLTGCEGEVVNEYSNHQCFYTFDYRYGHTVTPLHDALSGAGANIFCTLSVDVTGRGYMQKSQLYGKEMHNESITEEILTRAGRVLGLNNGVIIGYSSLQSGQLYVFDQICPNCYKEKQMTGSAYMLKLTDNGTNAQCDVCKRKYGLLNGGVVVAGNQGEKLYRYHATYDGTVLSIRNPL